MPSCAVARSVVLVALVVSAVAHSGKKQVIKKVVLANVAPSEFSCEGRGAGYYADLETGCQTYHFCDGSHVQYSYTCPNSTLFQQRMLICAHWYTVDCSRSERDYSANLLIGQKNKPFVGADDATQVIEQEQPGARSIGYKVTPVGRKEAPQLAVTSPLPPLPPRAVARDDSESRKEVTTVTTTRHPLPTEKALRDKTTAAAGEARRGKQLEVTDGVLRVRVPDFRTLFFIPNSKTDELTKEQLTSDYFVPVTATNELSMMRFKKHLPDPTPPSSCPSYCDPRYMHSATCHPCIMIK